MRRLRHRLYLLGSGGVMLGLIQGIGGVNYADILFNFLLNWIAILVAALFGGDLSSLLNATDGLSA
ncbi:MAG: hypothetical protein HZB38_16770 [Planctomycetes bacterium]|nr:hypothetical protein [Planctomycetota bacterium]